MTTFYGILIPFLGTTLGAACVFFLRKALGDRLQRAGGSKSLKELFIDRKIPRADRALLPVFAAQGEILAVAGLGVSSKFQPQAGAPALWIRIEKERM